jgi:ABC-type oligopeptide transport system substrate-binding subunit
MRLAVENATNWRDPDYDEIVEEARRVLDHDKRMRLYRMAEEMLVREAPLFPLYYNRRHLLVKPWIRNYRGKVFAATPWKDVIIDPH